MSDPVSNAEVEDVLSSIRRLVSEEKRGPNAAETPSSSDRLVLTPALRVAETARPVQADTTDDVALDVAVDTAAQGSSEDDEAIDNQKVSPPDNEGDDAGAVMYDPGDDEINHNDARSDDQLADVSETDDADNSEPETPEVLILVPDAAAHADDQHVETPQADTSAAETDDEQSDETSFDGSIEDAFTDIPDAEPVEAIEEISNATTFSAKIAALETVIGRTDDQWEPDDTGDSDYSGTEAPAMSWEDSDAVDEAAEVPNDSDVFASPEDFLDEDALRDLVSDIVREELQGALGERITRNVRKLVRREIHRALAAQELE